MRKVLSKGLLFGCLIFFFLSIFSLSTYLLFPYKKFLNLLVHNLLSESSMRFSIEGKRLGFFSLNIKAIDIGFEGIKDPIFELRDVRLTPDLIGLLKGKIGLSGKGKCKSGWVDIVIDEIALFRESRPFFQIRFNNVEIKKAFYGSTFIKGFKGMMDGTFRREFSLSGSEIQRGGFSLKIKDGEIDGLFFKGFPRISIPYSEITIKGTSEGDMTKIDVLTVNSPLGLMKASGWIRSSEGIQDINILISYEGFKKTPLSGRGEIRITGNLLSSESLHIEGHRR